VIDWGLLRLMAGSSALEVIGREEGRHLKKRWLEELVRQRCLSLPEGVVIGIVA